MNEKNSERALISISRKTFFQVAVLLAALLIAAVVMTYIVPRGSFGVLPDGSPDYMNYIRRGDLSGIPLWQGLLAPVLVFFSEDGLTLAVLSVFLFVIAAAFQVMNDVGSIRALVDAVSGRFSRRRGLLLVCVSFLFYCFGAFLGLFEEMLTMLPIVASLCVALGYDSFTGFLCSILACGFGFASAVTNPFTVLLASQIIGVNPMTHIWFRLVIFLVMFLLLIGFLGLYLRRLKRDPAGSVTLRHDEKISGCDAAAPASEARVRSTYAVFLLAALLLIIVSSVLPALRGYTVVILIVWFLFGGIAAGAVSCGELRPVLRSFGKGFAGALPTLAFIAMAASVKYVFDRGAILPTIVHGINALADGRSPMRIAVLIYLTVLVLEFFISSSTAKAILVMGLLAVVNVGLSKTMLVLLYTFADGYTNVLFPTSPVLLISLSMLEIDYFTWLKKGLPLFAVNLLLVLGFIGLGLLVGY